MLKLSRNGLGVLSSQYKSVLKKCAFLNMIAAGMFMFAPQAQAVDFIDGTNNDSAQLDTLKAMGTTVAKYDASGTTPQSTYGTLYITGSPANTNTKELFSTASDVSAGWIVNYGKVFFGEESTASGIIQVPATIKDKHNLLNSTVSDVMPAQGGGVIRNDTSSKTGVSAWTNIVGTTFENNSSTDFSKYNVTGSGIVAIAAGGVVSNVGIYDRDKAPSYEVASKNSVYKNNYTMQFVYADGGAMYNGLVSAYGDGVKLARTISIGDTFEFNHTGNEDMSQAMYDEVREAVTSGVTTNITQEWNAQKQYATANPNGVSHQARGGAIFNAGDFEITDGTFKYNYTTGDLAYGGAIYNTDRQTPDADTDFRSDASHMIIMGTNTFLGNSAMAVANDYRGVARGGAISNEGSKLNIDYGNYSEKAANITFKANYVKSKYNSFGGAIYNGTTMDSTPIQGVIKDINHTTFDGNYAEVLGEMSSTEDMNLARGGAIYNDGEITILDATFATNFVKSAEGYNKGYAQGGAIANISGTVYLGVHESGTGYVPQDIIFTDNKAEGMNGNGGAIYNQGGTIDANIEKTVLFSGNSDTKTHVSADRHEVSSAGGAIYGAAGTNASNTSNTIFNLSGNGKVVFDYFGYDNVYMAKQGNVSAKISFIGTNAKPIVRTSASPSASSDDDFVSSVDLGATFTGEGKYTIKQTQLNLIDGSNGEGTGYIHFDPSIDMSDTVVNMAGTMSSYFYLSSNNDTLDNNDFYISNSKSVLYYADYDRTYANFTLGNYIENNGLVVYDDMPQNSIAGDMYPGETTSGDTDVKIATTLVNRGIVSTATDKFITQNIHIGTLESENGKIYINTDNEASHLIKTDNEHVLIPEEKEGYDFGTYVGEHYDSEVIVIDNKVTGTTKITLVDMESSDYKQISLDEGQRIYFAKTQLDQGLEGYKWNVVNAVNDNYEIKIGYDENGTVYDWFLYRDKTEIPTIEPEDMVSITIPRATLEQLRSFRFPIDKTNRGFCNCYKDNCNNSFCRYEEGNSAVRLWATPFYRQGTFEKPFETDFKLAGIDLGVDYQPTTTDLIGVFGSYRYGKYENDGNKKHYGDEKKYFSYAGGEFELKSLTAGLYYRKYIDRLYLLGAVYAGKLDGDIKADNGVKGSIKGKHLGAQAEVGYDVKLTRRSTLTPSVRGTYDYIKYDKGHTSLGEEVRVAKINSFEIEAALKLEYQFNNERQLPTTGYVKPSVIQTIPDGGKVKVGNQEFKKTLDNETLGRIEVGADTNLTTNFSVGVFGNYTFGSHYEAWGVGGNVRYTW